jgi:hypothetical protein
MSHPLGETRTEREALTKGALAPPRIKVESRIYFAALGKRICILRKTRQMTQAELARAIGVSQQCVFAWELGDRRVSVPVVAAEAFSSPNSAHHARASSRVTSLKGPPSPSIPYSVSATSY